MPLLQTVANLLWAGSALPGALAFRWASRRVQATQRRLLMQILRRNAHTQFGIRHQFGQIDSPAAYQQTVPLATYDDLHPWLERIAAGEPNVLTAAPVRLLEPTSGSSAAPKLIPYTADLQADFQRGISPWIVHTFLHQPGLLHGSAYWSVTPVLARNRRSPGGIPIGFEEESEYFGGFARRLIDRLLAVPPAVKLISHTDSFRYASLRFLLARPDLRLISVWNPTFLTLLLAPLAQWQEELLTDLAAGSLTPPRPLDPDLHRQLTARLRPDPRRAGQVRTALAAGYATPPQQAAAHRHIWPRLGLISCWADANAAAYAGQVARLFPQARLQPKGLLATEGFVSLPLAGAGPGAALSVRSHFFEFLPADAPAARPRLAHELEIGGTYAVVLTTAGGLYRYRLGDLIRVTGKVADCPRLTFLGRAGAISDWFGEKLHEPHVQAALAPLLAQADLHPDFLLLACETARPPAYALFIQAPQAQAQQILALAAGLEEALAANPHYANCRRLGQLGPVRGFRIRQGGQAAFLARAVADGQRAGDVKPALLDRRTDWAGRFDGRFLR